MTFKQSTYPVFRSRGEQKPTYFVTQVNKRCVQASMLSDPIMSKSDRTDLQIGLDLQWLPMRNALVSWSSLFPKTCFDNNGQDYFFIRLSKYQDQSYPSYKNSPLNTSRQK